MSKVEQQLLLFQGEVEITVGAFYTWRAIDDYIREHPTLLATVNRTPLAWNTFQASNRTAFMVALGRLFDTDGDAFSVTAFLNTCLDNLQEFSLEALRQRKLTRLHPAGS